jgi:two-component system sensor histidine kinase CiaH
MMPMFRAALLKTTLLYLVIIMAISLFFSIIIYNVSTLEIGRNAGRQQNVIDRLGRSGIVPNDPTLLAERQQLIDEANNNIFDNLLYTNIAILVLAGGLSYYLAGRTIKPIEDSHDAQSRFTGDASHELRSPLAAMKAEIEVALRDPKLTRDEAIGLLKSNLEEVERLRTLSDGLLELARDNGKPIDKTDFELSNVIYTSVSKISKKSKEKNISIETDNDEHIQIHANHAQIEGLLVIILDNAIKYSEKDTNISIETSSKGKYAVLRIKDEGPGIGAEDLKKVFDRFYRVEKSRTKNTIPGYGLGLALAKKIVSINGGTIAAESRLGSGSTFTIRLPLVRL